MHIPGGPQEGFIRAGGGQSGLARLGPAQILLQSQSNPVLCPDGLEPGSLGWPAQIPAGPQPGSLSGHPRSVKMNNREENLVDCYAGHMQTISYIIAHPIIDIAPAPDTPLGQLSEGRIIVSSASIWPT